jgi:hypothetical protein
LKTTIANILNDHPWSIKKRSKLDWGLKHPNLTSGRLFLALPEPVRAILGAARWRFYSKNDF